MSLTIIVAAAAIALAVVVVAALLIYRRAWARTKDQPADNDEDPLLGGQRRSVWNVFRFIEGPFEISIALHVAIILALLWGVHLQAGRNLIMVKLQAGGGGGTQELKQLDMPEMPMPQMRMPIPIERPVVASQSSATITSASHYVRSVAGGGIGAGRGGGIGAGYGRGVGAGFGGFIAGLRKSGFEVTLVIDGTGSMLRVMADAKDKMRQLVLSIHRLVPAARIGIVVYGGRGEPIEVQPLTVSPDKLIGFLESIKAHNGGEWQEDLLGAVRTSIDRMGWKPGTRKVIVLVGDTPPFNEDYEPVLEEIRRFRAENGAFNTVDVTREEHERFIIEWYAAQGIKPPPGAIENMPSFYAQTQAAYQAMAAAGGGVWKSLTKDEHINQQVLILAFGEQWQTEVSAFGRNLTSSRADP
ncbi:MAG TPA: vWA domain-containing protein [Candidatus Binataceae bacterium]|nr:vWA domain-containing protein [Candidatus Binataceae bacterium]